MLGSASQITPGCTAAFRISHLGEERPGGLVTFAVAQKSLIITWRGLKRDSVPLQTINATQLCCDNIKRVHYTKWLPVDLLKLLISEDYQIALSTSLQI